MAVSRNNDTKTAPKSKSLFFYSIVTPMLLAVPSIIFIAASTSLALRSSIFLSAISLSLALVIFPALLAGVLPEPFSTPAAFSQQVGSRRRFHF